MTISGGRTEQLDRFCRVTGFTSNFLSFIVVELIRFFHGALHLSISALSMQLFWLDHCVCLLRLQYIYLLHIVIR